MALGSCYTCIKYLMFAFNFIFWLLGCALLGVGIWLRLDEEAAGIMAESTDMDIFHHLSYALMAIGFLIMLIGFLGCCGAIRESQCMLATFFLFLFIIFATLLGFGIWAAVAKDSFEEYADDLLSDAVANYGKDNHESETAWMDKIQTTFECCGVDEGIQDFDDPIYAPKELCLKYKNKPCKQEVHKWIENKLMIVAGIAIGIAVVMILGMIFSMVLCCAIRDAVA